MRASTYYSSMSRYFIIILGLAQVLGADPHHTPLETMADVTNDFGFCVLQIVAAPETNTVFSPYGLMSMALLIYEGTTGPAAAELYNSMHLPWHRDIVRIGFRDLHRYLRSYFSSEGFLKGLVLSKSNVPLKPSYIDMLKFYGFQPNSSVSQTSTTRSPLEEKDGNETETSNIPEQTEIPPLTTFQSPTTESSKANTTLPSKPKPSLATAKPTTSKKPSLPTTTKKPSLPTTTKKPSLPITTKKPSLPTTTEKPSLPTTMKTPSLPTTMKTPTILMTSKKPSTSALPNKTPATTIPTTSISTETTLLTTMFGTTKTEAGITDALEPQQTILAAEVTSELTQKTTRQTDVSTEEETTYKETIFTRELEGSTEMNYVTLDVEAQPEIKSMNMIVLHSEKNERSTEYPLFTFVASEISEIDTVPFTTISGLTEAETARQTDVSTEEEMARQTDESTEEETTYKEYYITNYLFSDEGLTDEIAPSTLFRPTDTTAPEDEIVILTTPFNDEEMPSKGMSMLDAIIFAEDKISRLKFNDSKIESSVKKRSEVSPRTFAEISTPQQSSQTVKYHQHALSNNEVNFSFEDHPRPTTGLEKTNYFEVSERSDLRTNRTTSSYNEKWDSAMTSDSKQIISELSALEPNTIIPTLRLPRAAKGEGKPQTPLGRVGWHPYPNSQWFRSPKGDKLVPVLTYTAYLPYVDLPELSATALQLPLDDPRYSMLLLLPKSTRGLKQMLHSLQWKPLRNILQSLKMTAVYAVVPTFTIIQHINLTPSLHKIGIRKIFDAYQANLCELSAEPNLYVRSVEQVITISVQKYFTFQKWSEATPSEVEEEFLASHPFAYFVVDVETMVALVAGTIVDPMLRNS